MTRGGAPCIPLCGPSASKWRRWRPSRHRRRWFGRSDDRELSALAALELKRQCIGFDISDEYVRVADARVVGAYERCRSVGPRAGRSKRSSGLNRARHTTVDGEELGAVGAKRLRRRTRILIHVSFRVGLRGLTPRRRDSLSSG